ncbi:MAG: ketoacyl-ACP synthase III [Candidatus Dadabacteria bacterium]|nr:MAG: ketoacyl-ACP synthase III [Candidatus Dadabacteria bacterium]
MVIAATGSYLPERVLHNHDLEKMVDTSDEWIYTRTGIRERRVAAPDEATSDICLQAARRAMEWDGVGPQDLDLIVVTTITPDTMCPSAACWLQNKLGADRAVAFDLAAACSGFLFGLKTVQSYLAADQRIQNVLLCSAEIMTRTVDYTDRSSCILWGDGGAAALIRRDGPGLHLKRVEIRTQGAYGEDLLLPGGGSRTTPISHESVDKKLHTLKLEGKKTFRVAVRCMAGIAKEVLEAEGLGVDDVDWVIPHQANRRIQEAVAQVLKLPLEKMVFTIEKYGNISSATIPIALDEAWRDGRIRPGHRVLLTAFGGGLTWGAALLEARG